MSYTRMLDYFERLEGPEYCNFRKNEEGDITWNCNNDFTQSTNILEELGFSEEKVYIILSHFQELEVDCDCEVLFHIEDEVLHRAGTGELFEPIKQKEEGNEINKMG